MKIDVNVVQEDDNNWGWPKAEGPLGGIRTIKIDLFDAATQFWGALYPYKNIPEWTNQSVEKMPLVYDKNTVLDDNRLFPTYCSPRRVTTQIYHNTDSKVDPDVIESEFGEDNPDRWIRQPLTLYDEDERENYETEGWEDDPIEEGSRRWKISTIGGFKFRIQIKSGEDQVRLETCPDQDLDGDKKRMKMKEGDSEYEYYFAPDPPVRYETLPSPPGSKFFLKIEEIGTNSYGNYLNDDGTEEAISWIHPYGIYYCPFDTSDSENFKITREPRYDAEEVQGNILDGGKYQLFLMPRRWYFYCRSTVFDSEGLPYEWSERTFSMNDENDSQAYRDFINVFYHDAGEEDGIGGSSQSRWINILINGYGKYELDEGGDPLWWEEHEPEETYSRTYSFRYQNFLHKHFGWWGRFPQSLPWSIDDGDDGWGDEWNDEHAYPSTFQASKMYPSEESVSEPGPEWSWCPTYKEIRTRYLDLNEYQDQEDLVNEMIVTGGTSLDFHMFRSEWPIHVYDDEWSQTYDTPDCPGIPTSQHDHWVQVDQARTSWNMTGPFMRSLYHHEPYGGTGCTVKWWEFKQKHLRWFSDCFMNQDFYEGFEWDDWYWQGTGEFDSTEIPFGIGISPTAAEDIVGIIRQRSKVYFVWRKTEEEMEELNDQAISLGHFSFEGHRDNGNINGMYIDQRNYGDDSGIVQDALGGYQYDNNVSYAQQDDSTAIDQFSGPGGRKMTAIGKEPNFSTTSASSAEILGDSDCPETNSFKDVYLADYSVAETQNGEITLHVPIFPMLSATSFSLQTDGMATWDNGWGRIIQSYEERVSEIT